MNDKNIEETNSKKPNLIEKKAEKWLNIPRPNAFEDRIYYNRYHNRKIGYTAGYTQAITDQQTALTQYKKALRETSTELEKVFMDWFPYDDEIEIHRIGAIVDKAKQLLNNREYRV